jgi:integrase
MSTIKSDKSRIENHIRPMLGKYKVAVISTEQIEDFIHGVSKGSAKRMIGLLGAMFSYAIKKKLRITNPAHGIERPEDARKTRRLSAAEYPHLWSALENEKGITADIFLFLALSGWRSGEARLLKFSEIDVDRRIASLSDTKSGQSFRPLNTAAIEIIQRKPRNSEYVFALQNGRPISNLTTYWYKLDLPPDVTPHTRRHSFASLAGDMGLADSTISGLLGHSRSSITSRYIHLDRALIAAADIVAQETLRLMRA